MFPVVALGTIMAALTSPLVGGGGAVAALVAAAIAAATAAGVRFPFTAVLLGVLLTVSAGPATTVPAIIGAVVGMLIRLAQSDASRLLRPLSRTLRSACHPFGDFGNREVLHTVELTSSWVPPAQGARHIESRVFRGGARPMGRGWLDSCS
jgi:hypothetical protein